MKITLNNKELRTVFRGIYGLIETIYYIGAEPEIEERTIHIGIGANVHGDLPGEIRERLEETLKRRFAEIATEEVRRIVGDE